MPRRIVGLLAVLLAVVLAVSAGAPGRLGPASAHQASPAAGTACPATTAEENEELVSRYYEAAYNQRDPAAATQLLSDDFVRHNVAAPQPNQQPGHADDIARVESWLAAFGDLQITIEDLYASSDTVVSYVIWTGTQDGPLSQWGAPATGRPMARESLVVWRVACKQLAENWIVQDNLTMLRQLGIITDEELVTAGTPTVATPVP
jgi:steroid delta-isomerase-like uncharacterized protein